MASNANVASGVNEEHRGLNEEANYYSTYFSDEYGYSYDPYSLSWRYLGMYVDCDVEGNANNVDGGNQRTRHRHLEDDGGNDCSRKVCY